MNEGLRSMRDGLVTKLEKYKRTHAALKDGTQKCVEFDQGTGRETDITADRANDFAEIINDLEAVIRDFDIKLGDQKIF